MSSSGRGDSNTPAAAVHVCKECRVSEEPPPKPRPAPYPGPRCFSHHRLKVVANKERAHQRHVMRTYGVDEQWYDSMLDFQGGKCAICQRATGASKRLAVDHDHADGSPRGVLCGPCNKDVIGRLNVEGLLRAVLYLQDPPANRWAEGRPFSPAGYDPSSTADAGS